MWLFFTENLQWSLLDLTLRKDQVTEQNKSINNVTLKTATHFQTAWYLKDDTLKTKLKSLKEIK